MKPIKIEISAFGPYKDCVEIDFSKICENGIFLITGDTGAGKTTIFDAIVFALYGNVSGSNRQVSSVRSDFATIDTKTYVKLEFSHKGKVYQVLRNPQYDRQKKSGEGFTTQFSDASIEEDGKVLASGVSNVDKKIQEILGIDVKQFKQISMLAQGEFLKILFADSKERTEIFRKIFDTYIYEDITKKLKEKQNDTAMNLNSYKTKFLTNTMNIKWSKEPEFLQTLSDKNIHNYIKDVLELLEIEVKNDQKDNDKINSDVYKLDKELKMKELKIQKAEEINSSYIRLDELMKKQTKQVEQKKNYDEKQKQVDNTQKILAMVLPKEQMYKKIQNEIEELNGNIKKNKEELEKLNKDEEEFKKKDIKVNEIKLKSNNLKIQYDIISKLENEIKNVDEILKVIDERDKYIEQIELLKKEEEQILKLKKIIQEYDNLSKEFEKIQLEQKKAIEIENIVRMREETSKNFDTKNKEFREIEDKYKLEEDKFYKGQAGILAKDLQEGQKCPVCGSIHHPELAKKSEALSKEELDELKIKKEKKEKEKNEVSERLSIYQAKIDTLIEDAEYDSTKKSISEYVTEINEKYKIQESNLKEKINEAESIYFDITKLKLDFDEFNYDGFKNDFDDNKKKMEDKLTRDNTLIDDFYKKMQSELSDKTDIKEYAEDIKLNYKNKKNEYREEGKIICDLYYEITKSVIDIEEFEYEQFKDEYEKSKREHSKKIIEVGTKISEFMKNLDDKGKELEKSKDEYEMAFKNLGFESEAKYKASIMDETILHDAIEEIQNYRNQCIEVNTQIKELKDNLKGNERIDIEKDKKEFETLKESLEELKEKQLKVNSKYTSNNNILEILNNDSGEVLKQTELYLTLEELYKTASGTLSGKRRIEFEQYIQAVYFDIILIEANKRLVKMTGNRYELVRKENSNKISDKIGLDLEVIDNYTGKRRDVKSLSGGESFKAALSLSLGVSDVIQSYSGGVVVDTLFIDEGFGSLDAESREQAINTLNLLTDNDKIIGIISHVTELKERIDKKIIIEKTSNGSKISLEV